MATSELLEERLSAMEGLVRIMRLNHNIPQEIPLAVCEYNLLKHIDFEQGLEAIFNLQDMLVIAQNLNAFLRHAHSVKMANISEIVNMGGPIRTNPDGDGIVLQTTWHALALYSRLSGDLALDAWLDSDASFSGGGYSGVPLLDVAATRDQAGQQLTLFVINRTADAHSEVTIHLEAGRFDGAARANILNGPQLDSENTFETPERGATADRVAADAGAHADLHARAAFPDRAGTDHPSLMRRQASSTRPHPPAPSVPLIAGQRGLG